MVVTVFERWKMFRLDCSLKCVACENDVTGWTTRDMPNKWRFFSKCGSCGVVNLFSASRSLSLEGVERYAREGLIRTVLTIAEMDRLKQIRKRYKIPEHIPIAQYEKFRKIKIDQRCPLLEESLH